MEHTLSILLLLTLAAPQCLGVTPSEESSAISSIENFITRFSRQNSGIANPSAKLVRLIFHDCVGGCDGCVNLNNSDNRGLERTYFEINAIYNANFSTVMSRADFIALAGTVAIRQASLEQDCQRLRLPPGCVIPVPNITLRYGRKDCPSSPMSSANREFPRGHGDLNHVLRFFRMEMNMTVREIVAIIGAHSLGTASVTQSGFRGPWAPPTNRFSNDFYRVLMAPNNMWRQIVVNATNSVVFPNVTYQWNNMPPQGQMPLLMLNSDMCLFSYIRPNANGREMNNSCRMLNTNCPRAATADIVVEFATNNTLFFEEFAVAFQKLAQNGYSETELVTARQEDTMPPSGVGSMYVGITVMITVIVSLFIFLLV